MGTSLSTQSQTNSTEPKVESLAEKVSPYIAFTSPYFLPTTTNVLVLESFLSMGGARLGYALLYSPHVAAGGIIVDSSGKLCNVPQDRWEEMETVVRRAKEVSEQLGQSSWSRPQMASCPMSVYFDLGPSENPDGLYRLQRTAHQVSTENVAITLQDSEATINWPVMKHPEIRTWTESANGKHEETTLKEMPEPIVALERALSQLHQDLLPHSSNGSSPIPEGDDVLAMVAAIKNLCGSVRTERQFNLSAGKIFYEQSRRHRGSWFRWW
ncbi:hypothetical protein B0H19DRAFT_1122594 [Mycena capillaripes]|nr:hypothetical protein B0H19DRAFT_1122594 [Mycena capillaripes]